MVAQLIYNPMEVSGSLIGYRRPSDHCVKPGTSAIYEGLMLVSELLDSEEKWCQQTHYRKEGGKPGHKHEAVAWSLNGALNECTIHLCQVAYGTIYELMILQIMMNWPDRFNEELPLFNFNDHPDTTYEDILEICRRVGV